MAHIKLIDCSLAGSTKYWNKIALSLQGKQCSNLTAYVGLWVHEKKNKTCRRVKIVCFILHLHSFPRHFSFEMFACFPLTCSSARPLGPIFITPKAEHSLIRHPARDLVNRDFMMCRGEFYYFPNLTFAPCVRLRGPEHSSHPATHPHATKLCTLGRRNPEFMV